MMRPTRIARRVESEVPGIAAMISEVAVLCAEHDPDIDLDKIMIDIRTMRRDGTTAGWCHGSHVVVYVDFHPYPDSLASIAGTLAHELRHYGQHARERQEVSPYWGDNTPHDERPSETDAEAFAKMIVSIYGNK